MAHARREKSRSPYIWGLVTLLIAGGIFALFLPAMLRSLPSRYLLYLPVPLQQLGARGHVDTLPAPAVADNGAQRPEISALLLAPTTLPTLAAIATVPPPVVSISTAEGGQQISPTFTPKASPTPPATAIPTPTPLPFLPAARISNVQHQFQSWNNCGPATIAMALSHFQILRKQEETADWLKPNPEDRNVSPEELVNYVRSETDLESLARVNSDLDTLKRFISYGFPVIIETGIDPPGDYSWMDWYGHYYLVIGYDDNQQKLWVYDSWLGTGENAQGELISSEEGRTIDYADLDSHWRQFNRQLIVSYAPEDQNLVTEIIGRENLDDQTMWQRTLDRTRQEVEAEPDNAYLWFNIGTIYNNLGEYELAAAAYDESRRLGLPWRMLWYQFGPYEAYLNANRYADVIELADVTLFQRPYFEESYYYRGLAKIALGETRDGQRDLQAAADFNPRFQKAQDALAALSN
ncbi:MAG: tetratricopeptide (TPR) repeat protein [Cellvibrionaceae bacterium]|jgi:tetratricopeptide (TPR) repeat protein